MELCMDTVSDKPEAEQKKELATQLRESPGYDTIYKRWESSSRMRQWF